MKAITVSPKDYHKMSKFDWRIELWSKDPRLSNSMSKLNVVYLRKLKELYTEFGRNNALLYFCTACLGLKSCNPMFSSGIKQRTFVQALTMELKRRTVTTYYIELFDWLVDRLNTRLSHVFRIVKENIYLTEYYPFFEEVGWDVLNDFDTNIATTVDCNEQLKFILDDFAKFKETHPELIKKHMDTVQPIIDTRNNHFRNVKEAEKLEKKLARDLDNKERAMEREIKRNQEAYKKQQKNIDAPYWNNAIYGLKK